MQAGSIPAWPLIVAALFLILICLIAMYCWFTTVKMSAMLQSIGKELLMSVAADFFDYVIDSVKALGDCWFGLACHQI